jgi:hypothetical protein
LPDAIIASPLGTMILLAPGLDAIKVAILRRVPKDCVG